MELPLVKFILKLCDFRDATGRNDVLVMALTSGRNLCQPDEYLFCDNYPEAFWMYVNFLCNVKELMGATGSVVSVILTPPSPAGWEARVCHAGSLAGVMPRMFLPWLGFLPCQMVKWKKEVKSCSELFHLKIVLSRWWFSLNTQKLISVRASFSKTTLNDMYIFGWIGNNNTFLLMLLALYPRRSRNSAFSLGHRPVLFWSFTLNHFICW